MRRRPLGQARLDDRFRAAVQPIFALPRDAFIEALVADIPPKQPAMDDVVTANLRGVLPEAAAV